MLIVRLFDFLRFGEIAVYGWTGGPKTFEMFKMFWAPPPFGPETFPKTQGKTKTKSEK